MEGWGDDSRERRGDNSREGWGDDRVGRDGDYDRVGRDWVTTE